MEGETSVEQQMSEAIETLSATYCEDPFRVVFPRRFIMSNACVWSTPSGSTYNTVLVLPAFLISSSYLISTTIVLIFVTCLSLISITVLSCNGTEKLIDCSLRLIKKEETVHLLDASQYGFYFLCNCHPISTSLDMDSTRQPEHSGNKPPAADRPRADSQERDSSDAKEVDSSGSRTDVELHADRTDTPGITQGILRPIPL